MSEPHDLNRTLTRIQHLEKAKALFADENRRLNELLVMADAIVAASIIGNGVDFANARKQYLDARQGPNP